jgi:hypothetical protein
MASVLIAYLTGRAPSGQSTEDQPQQPNCQPETVEGPSRRRQAQGLLARLRAAWRRQ